MPMTHAQPLHPRPLPGQLCRPLWWHPAPVLDDDCTGVRVSHTPQPRPGMMTRQPQPSNLRKALFVSQNYAPPSPTPPPPVYDTQVNVVAKHKKNPAAGNKMQLRKSPILIDQADAQSVVEGEEVTLMEWGNAYVRVRQSRAASGERPLQPHPSSHTGCVPFSVCRHCLKEHTLHDLLRHETPADGNGIAYPLGLG